MALSQSGETTVKIYIANQQILYKQYINNIQFKLVKYCLYNIQQNLTKQSAMSKQNIFDVSKLSTSSLRKYQSYFGLNCSDEELKQKVKEHFDKDLKAEPNQVIDRFLQLKREDKDKKGGRARNTRMPPV